MWDKCTLPLGRGFPLAPPPPGVALVMWLGLGLGLSLPLVVPYKRFLSGGGGARPGLDLPT